MSEGSISFNCQERPIMEALIVPHGVKLTRNSFEARLLKHRL